MKLQPYVLRVSESFQATNRAALAQVQEAAEGLAAVGDSSKPDLQRTELVKAYVVLKPDHAPSDALATELQDFVKSRSAKHAYLREVEFIDALPMTVTGKVIRKELRARAAKEVAR